MDTDLLEFPRLQPGINQIPFSGIYRFLCPITRHFCEVEILLTILGNPVDLPGDVLYITHKYGESDTLCFMPVAGA